jgi:hypothetical protein
MDVLIVGDGIGAHSAALHRTAVDSAWWSATFAATRRECRARSGSGAEAAPLA